MPSPSRPAPRRFLVASLAALALVSGCAAQDPDPGPSLVGTRGRLCDDRVDAAKAESVVDQPVSGLRELSTFEPGRRVGRCALQGEDGGGLLSVEVVHDAKGSALAKELEKMSQTENYTGDKRSGVTGEDSTTTALVAVDSRYYVRVLGLGGSQETQRQAALDLAEDVATRTAPLK
ncbi:MAG: hypothetical protein QM695_06905 [Micropruina sp.]